MKLNLKTGMVEFNHVVMIGADNQHLISIGDEDIQNGNIQKPFNSIMNTGKGTKK